VILSACLLSLFGCQAGQSPGGPKSDGAEHPGHVVPAHKPRTFPEAVARLKELNRQLGRTLAGEELRPVLDEKHFTVALDIANWLPEIAADSDMPPSPWNEVHARAADLAATYEKVRSSGSLSAMQTALEEANDSILAIDQVLQASDRRWFDEPRKTNRSPDSESPGPAPADPSRPQGP
jgi:hypothetical protein